ncbi:hypothetical protein [Ferrimonas futtsuensis]|uniref:hypothetical protein n=1 Tax=Ferrimonas futtsuensis TaxID=364764 RepID=UPI0012F9D49E|nr:hypothetical protein [Ferrimonas futtsuensis]
MKKLEEKLMKPMQPSDLLDRYKACAGVDSDYKVHKLLNVTQPAVSDWRKNKTFPRESLCLEMAETIGVDPTLLILWGHIFRAKDHNIRNIYYGLINLMPHESKIDKITRDTMKRAEVLRNL